MRLIKRLVATYCLFVAGGVVVYKRYHNEPSWQTSVKESFVPSTVFFAMTPLIALVAVLYVIFKPIRIAQEYFGKRS